MNPTIRPLTPEDEPFLWEMLYHALYVPEGHPPPSRDVIDLPELARYVRGWGREGDCGFLAADPATGQPIGAVWLRLLQGAEGGYGHVDDRTPELSIAVLPGFRGQGVGTQLLGRLLASPCGAVSVSLSVSPGNPAQRLYERCGFVVVARSGSALTMRRAG